MSAHHICKIPHPMFWGEPLSENAPYICATRHWIRSLGGRYATYRGQHFLHDELEKGSCVGALLKLVYVHELNTTVSEQCKVFI